jgi:hypothetical protein
VVERWILARLRYETFFSLERLNERVAELVVELNGRKMRVHGASGREKAERIAASFTSSRQSTDTRGLPVSADRLSCSQQRPEWARESTGVDSNKIGSLAHLPRV